VGGGPAAGCGFGADAIVAGGARAADPHYHPAEEGAPLGRDEVVLLDLWGKEQAEAVYADQTWMAYLGPSPPEDVGHAWSLVRAARDGAVRLIADRWAAGSAVHGHEVDEAAREVIRRGGLGDSFIHRTGHSIDRDLHGMGPNLDNYETRELRRLLPGIGFSVEPGVYLPGRFGLRSEINVYLGGSGPEVTTPAPQTQIRCLLPERGG
jgi:Xaa-Pro dipeptidase